MQKSILFRIHSVSGLFLGVFIILMSISGAALVFHEDLDQIQFPKMGDNNNIEYSVNNSFAGIMNYYPNAQISSCELPAGNANVMIYSVYDKSYYNGEAAQQVFFNTDSNNIQKTRGGSEDISNNFMAWLAKFHNTLHLGKTGEWLLGFFAFIFLISLITGIVIFRKNIPAVLLFKKSVYNRRNLHQVIGVYAIVFNLMIAVTGFWMQRYVFKKEFYASGIYTPVLSATPALTYNFDSTYIMLKKTYPDFTARVIYFAQSSKGKTAIYGSRASNAYIHSKKFADVIFIDSSGAISKTRFINEIDAADRYDIINSQLHMGKFGGAGIKIIYFVFGLIGALLSITGFLLWLRRRKQKY